MRSADRDVRDMWEKAEKMRKSLVGVWYIILFINFSIINEVDHFL